MKKLARRSAQRRQRVRRPSFGGVEHLEPRLALAVVPVPIVNAGNGSDFASTVSGCWLNGVNYFPANSIANSLTPIDKGLELWRSDGTPSGTYRLKDINPGKADSLGMNTEFLTVGSTIFFTADDGVHGEELWKTDGTSAGTVMIKDINVNGEIDLGTGVLYSESSFPYGFTNVNGTIFFCASTTGNVVSSTLWKTDGTRAGTVMVSSVGNVSDLTRAGSLLFFTANDGVHGSELWKTDGTAAGTAMVKDINTFGEIDLGTGISYTEGCFPDDLINVNGTIFFSAAKNGREQNGFITHTLWKTDGTAAGTVELGAVTGHGAMSAGGRLYYAANGGQLWTSDGTVGGTRLLRDFGADHYLTISRFKDTLLFVVEGGTAAYGAELWRSDGSVAGTVRVRELQKRTAWPDSLGAYASQCVIRDDGMYFSTPVFPSGTVDETARTALWRSDGTPAGTTEVRSSLSQLVIDPISNRKESGVSYSDGPLWVSATNNHWNLSIYAFLPPRPPSDVNGDGRSDLISRDAATGQIVAEIRRGTGALVQARVLGTEPIPLPVDGSFESPAVKSNQIVTYAAGAVLGKWRVLEGNVQISGRNYWEHAAGSQSLELNGTRRGGVYQDVATRAGGTYDLAFQLAGNVGGGPAVKTVDIYWGPPGSQSLVRQVTFDTTERTKAAMGWRTIGLPDLKAVGSTTRLTIVSRTDGAYGPVIDDLRLTDSSAGDSRFVAAADVTGDGVSDLIWWRPATGVYTLWTMRIDGTVVSRQPLQSVPNVTLAATGDFDADGTEDLVWRNSVSGIHRMWLMKGGVPSAKPQLTVPSTWRLSPAGRSYDANNDGSTDLVWFDSAKGTHELWLMAGSQPLAKQGLGNATVAGASIVAAGDFDADGHGDLLWRSPKTGAVTMQLMRSGAVTSSRAIGGDLDSSVAWTGDLNADRATDIVWNSRTSGRNVSRIMRGATTIATWAAYGDASRWSIVGRPG